MINVVDELLVAVFFHRVSDAMVRLLTHYINRLSSIIVLVNATNLKQ